MMFTLEILKMGTSFFSGTKTTQLEIHEHLTLVSCRNDCIEKKDSPEVFFCCCEGNMCNERFFYFPEMEVTQRKFLLMGIFHMVLLQEIRLFQKSWPAFAARGL